MPKSAEFRLDKIKKFLMYVRENKDDFAAKELEEVFEDIVEEHQNFVTRPEIRELIIEMREGFKMMDKRFNDLIQFTEKRFNDLLHHVDKRFEDMNARINFLQWVMAFFMSLLFGLLTYFNYKQMDLLNKILESNQQIQAELKNK
jgi:hypothetical protein